MKNYQTPHIEKVKLSDLITLIACACSASDDNPHS